MKLAEDRSIQKHHPMNTAQKGKIFERIIEAIQKVLEPKDSIIHTNKKLSGTRDEIDMLIKRTKRIHYSYRMQEL